MTATLIIDQDIAWMPSRATFHTVVEEAARVLQNSHNQVLLEMLQEAQADGLDLLDLSSLEAKAFDLFTQAVETVFEDLVTDPVKQAWPDFLKAVAELKAILLADPRITSGRGNQYGEILTSSANYWQTAAPGYNLILEFVALVVKSADAALFSLLLTSRVGLGSAQLDMTNFDKATFQLFLKGIRALETHYLRPFGLSARPALLPQLYLDSLNLFNGLKQDIRAEGFQDEHAFEYLTQLILNPTFDKNQRYAATWEIGYRAYDQAEEVLQGVLEDPAQLMWARVGAIAGLADLGSLSAIEILLKASESQEANIREAARARLHDIGLQDFE